MYPVYCNIVVHDFCVLVAGNPLPRIVRQMISVIGAVFTLWVTSYSNQNGDAVSIAKP